MDNQWVIFEFRDLVCVGRTCYVNNKLFVSTITEECNMGFVPWELVRNPRKMNIDNGIMAQEKHPHFFGAVDLILEQYEEMIKQEFEKGNEDKLPKLCYGDGKFSRIIYN